MRAWLIALLLCLAAVASAQARDCNSETLTQTDMNQCAGDKLKAADAALNAKYNKIVACLKDEAKALTDAQRAWIKFRDEECKFQGAGSQGGSIHPFVVDSCMTTVTAQRNKELDYYLTCQEGDASCPTYQCGFHGDKRPQ